MAPMATPVDKAPGPGIDVKRIRPAYQQVADQLREQILVGRLQPGHRLPVEAELSGVFGVSRSTVREALRVLGSQDLIHTVRGVTGGTFVSQTDPESVAEYLETRLGLLTGHAAITAAELLEARRLLEVPATRLAATRRTDEQIAAMHASIERERRETERSERFVQHQQFHQDLLEAADNRLLGIMTVPIFRTIRSRFLHDHAPRDFWQEVDDDHVAILARVEASDPEGAAVAMAAHLDRVAGHYRTDAPA